MNKRMNMEHLLGWSGFLCSSLFLLTIALSSIR
jgi:hypothetical protein